MVSTVSRLPSAGVVDPATTNAWLDALAEQRSGADIEPLRQAVALLQQGASGEPIDGPRLLSHLQVVEILDQLNLDVDMLITGLLCGPASEGVIDDEQVERRFGAGVAHMVRDVNRLQVLSTASGNAADNRGEENLRRLLLGMADDVRAILVMLACRLQVMRDLKHEPEHQQRRIAAQTQRLHAPLANRLGVWQLKWELEDLALRYLEPEAYRQIAHQLADKRQERETFIHHVTTRLQQELVKLSIRPDISGRPKHIYSIWKKMQRKKVGLEQIFDVRAVRVLVDTIPECYEVLGVVHGLWRPISGEFDDYIARPKANGYSSLHTAVIGDDGRSLEVQVRTREMHDHAERGVAAHWRYKEDSGQDAELERRIEWMRQWLEQQASDEASQEPAPEFEARNIYVLTPQGKVVELPAGSTAVDFAYAIHTSIGHRCRGAKVDGRIIPLTQPLASGQTVEVLTVKEGGPSRDWLNPHAGYLATARARNRVRQWFKQQDHDQHVQIGRSSLDRELSHLNLARPDLDKLAPRFNYSQGEELLAAIGRGDLSPLQVANSQVAAEPEDADAAITARAHKKAAQVRTGGGNVVVAGVGDLMTHMAKCCKPVPYDEVVGYITRGRGITVHRRDCQVVQKMDAENRERLIDVVWADQPEDAAFLVDIQVYAVDRKGLLKDISSTFSNANVDVLGVQTQSDRREERASMRFTVEIRDMDTLSQVLGRLAQLPDVIEVRRQR